jgi:hypothetical protein
MDQSEALWIGFLGILSVCGEDRRGKDQRRLR